MSRRVDENGYTHDDHDPEVIDKDLTIAALRARVEELERLVDRLIETCPEARPTIAEFALEALNR